MAILLTLLSDLFIIFMAAFAKELGTEYNALEVAFIRNFGALIGVTAWIIATRQIYLFKTTRIKGQLARAAVGQTNTIFVYWAYALLPLAMVTSILFLAPIFILILSVFILNEKVGIFRWLAVIAGFLGIGIISYPALIQSGDAAFSQTGLYVALAATIGTALVQITLRSLGREGEPALTTIFYFMLIGSVVMGVPVFLNGFDIAQTLWIAMIGIGIVGLGGQIFKTIAYQMGEASLLAPFRYLSIIWSVIIGYFFFQEIPSTETLLGAAIIIAANIVIVIREQQKKKQ